MDIKEKLNKNIISRFLKKDILICFLISGVLFFLDRISKIKILDFQLNNDNYYINDYINIQLIWNTGIGFGLFESNTSIIYNLITFLIGCILIFIVYLISKSDFLDKILFSIIFAGGLGNFYDRIVYYAVPDFIDLHYQNFHWFTFNVADIFITIGVILLIFKEFIKKDAKI